MQPDFTRSELKAAIPDNCFKSNTARSMMYVAIDLALIGACYFALSYVSAWYLEAALLFFIGTLCWSIFVLGHEAGHGAFSPSRKINTIMGVLLHGMILVPYRGWQRSHALHHGKTGHLRQEEVYRPSRLGEESLFRKIIFRSGIFVLVGWPLYKLGFRNVTTYSPVKGSHYLPTSDLYAHHLKWSWVASLAACALFLSIYLSLGFIFGWGFFAKYIVAPYVIYGAWLVFVTYMHHVSPEVPIYDGSDWTSLKGALSTVDRNYGVFNWLTHHVGDRHVIHHLFPTIPHYHAAEATDAIRPLLGELYLSSGRSVLLDFGRTLIGCHFTEPVGGMDQYKSALPFAPNYSDGTEAAPDH